MVVSNILMFSLGNKLNEKSQNTSCIFDNQMHPGKYFLEVYFQEINFDKIICFGNSNSSWDFLYKLMYLKYYGEKASEENLEFLKEIPDLETIKEFFLNDEKLKDKIIIKYFEEDLAKKEMIDYIYELQELMMNSEKIWVDITGGKRDLPIFVVQLLNLIVGKSYKKNNIEILYTKEKDRDRKIYETISLKDFLDKLDYTDEISAFSKYACPMKFMGRLKDNNLKYVLKKIYVYTQYNLTSELVESLKNFKSKKWQYTVYIQRKIIETKIEQWRKLLSNTLEKDTLLDYHLELSNEPLGMIAKYEATNLSNLRNIRNSIVHPYSMKGVSYEVLQKAIEENFYQNTKKEKFSEVLIVNIGNANNYEVVNYKKQNLSTRFSFKALMKETKFEKIFLIGLYSNVWNKFIDNWILEEKLDIKRENNITIDIPEKEFEETLNKELKKLDKKFEAIVIDNSFSEIERNKYFEKIAEKLIRTSKKYSITYDFTFSFRDISFLNYINLHCLELLGMIRIKKLVYIPIIKKGVVDVKDLDRINSVMNLFKTVDEFKLYNKFDEKIDINIELKKLMEKISKVYNFNQISIVDKMRNEIENFHFIGNKIEEDILNFIKEKYIYKGTNKYLKAKETVRNQLGFNNFAQALFLLWDLILKMLIEKDMPNKEAEQRIKKDFLEESSRYGHKELYNFYKKYEYLNIIRNEGAHINLREMYFPLEKIDKEIEKCLKELDALLENKEAYNKSFLQYEKDVKKK